MGILYIGKILWKMNAEQSVWRIFLCVVFAYDKGIGCMVWSCDLIDIQKFSSGGVSV